MRVELERVESVPDDAAVRHYDELDEDAKQLLPGLLAGEAVPSSTSAPELRSFATVDGEIVKFTDYYRVRWTAPP